MGVSCLYYADRRSSAKEALELQKEKNVAAVDSIYSYTLKKYVYEDETGCLHSSRYCPNLHKLRNHGVTRFHSARLTKVGPLCERCISDAVYEKIDSIISSNTAMEYDTED